MGTLNQKEKSIIQAGIVFGSIALVFIFVSFLRKVYFKKKIRAEIKLGLRKSETQMDYYEKNEDGITQKEKDLVKLERGFGENTEKLERKMKKMNKRR